MITVIGATLIGVINLGMFQVNLDANKLPARRQRLRASGCCGLRYSEQEKEELTNSGIQFKGAVSLR